jgi:hypothetical protein
MENITNTIKAKYYRYQPGEFLPVYQDGELSNRSDFHRYRIRQLISRPADTLRYFTHYSSLES